jgi:hypothetical protein
MLDPPTYFDWLSRSLPGEELQIVLPLLVLSPLCHPWQCRRCNLLFFACPVEVRALFRCWSLVGIPSILSLSLSVFFIDVHVSDNTATLSSLEACALSLYHYSAVPYLATQ